MKNTSAPRSSKVIIATPTPIPAAAPAERPVLAGGADVAVDDDCAVLIWDCCVVEEEECVKPEAGDDCEVVIRDCCVVEEAAVEIEVDPAVELGEEAPCDVADDAVLETELEDAPWLASSAQILVVTFCKAFFFVNSSI